MKRIFFLSFLTLLVFAGMVASGYSMGLDFGGGSASPASVLDTSPFAHFGVSGNPMRLAVDDIGRIYVTNESGGTVDIFSNNGVLLKKIGGIGRPLAIAISGTGEMYVGDGEKGRVLIFSSAGVPLRSLGDGDGEFAYPGDIALDPSGNIFVSDSKAPGIKVYSPEGVHLNTFGSEELSFPTGIAIDSVQSEVYVSDTTADSFGRKWIRIYDLNGVLQRSIRVASSFSATVLRPQGIALDDNNLYVVDAFNVNGAIAVYTKSGLFVESFGNYGKEAGEFRTPLDAAFDGDNKLIVTNYNNMNVEEIDLGFSSAALSLTPLEIVLTAIRCDMPLSGVISVSSNVPGAAWSATVSDPSWMSISASSGITPDAVTVTVDPSGLDNNVYTGFVHFINQNGIESVVKVRLIVNVQVSLDVTPSTITFLHQINGDLPEEALLVDSSGCGVQWNGSTSAGTDPNWLTVNPSTGTTPSTVTVGLTDDVRNFNTGTYSGTVSIDAGSVAGSPASVDVTLKVVRAGTVTVTTNLENASFIIKNLKGPEYFEATGTYWRNDEVPPGEYKIDYQNVTGYQKPASDDFTVVSGQRVDLEGIYVKKKQTTSLAAVSNSMSADSVSLIDIVDMPPLVGSFPIVTKRGADLAKGDFDGDGADEIAVSNKKDSLKIYANDGSIRGELAFEIEIVGITSADLNHDGKPEIVAGLWDAVNHIRLIRYAEYSDGEYVQNDVNISTHGPKFYAIATGDFNSDGRTDFALAEEGMVTIIEVLENANKRNKIMKRGRIIAKIPVQSKGELGIAAGDMNGDGVYELLISSVSNSGESMIRIVNADGSDYDHQMGHSGYRGLASVSSGDIDGDGEDEIIVGAPEGDVITVYESDCSDTGMVLNAQTGAFGVEAVSGGL